MLEKMAVTKFSSSFSTTLPLLMNKREKKYFQDLPVLATVLAFNMFLLLASAFYMATFSVHLLVYGRQVCRNTLLQREKMCLTQHSDT